MTSGDLNIDLSEKMIEMTSNDLVESFRLLFFRVFLALLVFELVGGHFDPPHQGEGGSEALQNQLASTMKLKEVPRFAACRYNIAIRMTITAGFFHIMACPTKADTPAIAGNAPYWMGVVRCTKLKRC